MRSFSFMILILSLTGLPVFGLKRGDVALTFSGGLNVGGSGFSSLFGESVGEYGFGDDTLFQSSAAPDVTLGWQIGTTASYFVNRNLSFDGGLQFSAETFSVRYLKNSASNDLVFRTELQLLKVPFMMSFHALPFIGSLGFSYNAILKNESTIALGSSSTDSDLASATDSVAVILKLGLGFDLSQESRISIFLGYDQGLGTIYSEPYWISDVTLIGMSLNVGYTVKLSSLL